jgi:hypothetical protein
MTNLPITDDFTVTATYGQKGDYWVGGHQGIDIVAPNKTIYATCDGTVRVVNYDKGGWGRYVTIGDDNGLVHIFCHLENNSVRVKPGDKVNRTTVIGIMGTTGNSTGVHLHYQINRNGVSINPCDHLDIPNKKGKYNSKNYEIREETNMYKDDDKIAKWAKDAVYYAKDKGYMVGDADGNFRPKDPLTREEMAVILKKLDEVKK